MVKILPSERVADAADNLGVSIAVFECMLENFQRNPGFLGEKQVGRSLPPLSKQAERRLREHEPW